MDVLNLNWQKELGYLHRYWVAMPVSDARGVAHTPEVQVKIENNIDVVLPHPKSEDPLSHVGENRVPRERDIAGHYDPLSNQLHAAKEFVDANEEILHRHVNRIRVPALHQWCEDQKALAAVTGEHVPRQWRFLSETGFVATLTDPSSIYEHEPPKARDAQYALTMMDKEAKNAQRVDYYFPSRAACIHFYDVHPQRMETFKAIAREADAKLYVHRYEKGDSEVDEQLQRYFHDLLSSAFPFEELH